MSEYVLIDIAGYSSYLSGHADVTAQFFMRNLGEVTEQMRARFPMNHAYYDLDEEAIREDFCAYSPMPSLDGIRVWVDEVEVEVEISYEQMIDYMASPRCFRECGLYQCPLLGPFRCYLSSWADVE